MYIFQKFLLFVQKSNWTPNWPITDLVTSLL